MSPCVSVVVPTRARPELLERCLAALAGQELEPCRYEVIVVDDAPALDTFRQVTGWARRECERGLAIRYLAACHEPHGPAAARNRGWRAARGEIIAFTDDDCLPEPDWLRAGLTALAPGISGVYGRVSVPLPDTPTDYQQNAALLEHASYLTANAFYRRCALEEAGGFDERFELAWREDSDLAFTLLDLGHRIEHAPAARVVHPVRPARWGVSVGQQHKAMYNALLHRKHPERFPWSPRNGPIWEYYRITGALLATAAALALDRRRLGLGFAALWAALVGRFARRRLAGTSKAPRHVAEMIATSTILPPLGIFWRLRGAVRYRVPYF